MELTKRNKNCTEDIFWECVKEMDWASDPDHDVVKRACLVAWTPEFGTEFSKVYGEKHSIVGKVFQEYAENDLSRRQRDEYYLGDDSFGDFCSHVVGMGREVFDAELANPEMLYERVVKGDYSESFGYCIPNTPSKDRGFEDFAKCMGYDITEEEWKGSYRETSRDETFEEYMKSIRDVYFNHTKGDWAYIMDEHYFKLANRYNDHLSEFVEELGGSSPSPDADESEALALAKGLMVYFQAVLDRDREKAIKISETALESWWRLYYIAEDQGNLRAKHADLLPMGDQRHGGENTINDYRIYMGGLPKFKCMYHLHLIRKEAA